MGFAFAQPVREKGEESTSVPSSSSYPVNKGVRIKKKKKGATANNFLGSPKDSDKVKN